MWRKRVLKVVLVVERLIFVAGIYPLVTSVRDGWRANKEDPLPMGISLYVTQGIFLLLATRDPLANRGVITFAAWLNIAHGAVMTIMAIHLSNERQAYRFRCVRPHRSGADCASASKTVLKQRVSTARLGERRSFPG